MRSLTPATAFSTESHDDTGTGEPGPMLVWRFATPRRAIASAVLGGGIREVTWAINAHVRADYDRMDPQQHLSRIAATAGLDAMRGVGLLTAANLDHAATAFDGSGAAAVRCDATVGVSYPTWASAPDGDPIPPEPWRPGTINVVCQVPVPLADAALVGAVLTVTEAKAQALWNGGVAGTGTASDAVMICCPATTENAVAAVPFAGPRSEWGARLARATCAAVTDGLAKYLGR